MAIFCLSSIFRLECGSYMKIFINGSASTGKGTAAKKLAKILGYDYVSLGDIYRSIAVLLARKKISFDDSKKIKEILEKIEMRFDDGYIKIDSEEMEGLIRNEEVANIVAAKLTTESNKKLIIAFYKNIFSRLDNIVIEGRDGLEVDYSFFLTATLETKAKRALNRDEENGIPLISLEEKMRQIGERDKLDSNHKIGALGMKEGDIEIVTDNLNPDGVVSAMLDIINSSSG